MPEKMKCKINKDKNGENVPHLEIREVILVPCNIVHNDYQQDSSVLYTIVSKKPFGRLLKISPKDHIFLKHLIQNLKPLKYGLQVEKDNS